MSAKRVATTDLNHENWDKEDKPEEAGTFKKASEEELKKRIIKTARRKSGQEIEENKSVFATFAGFKNTEEPKNSTPFSFLAKPKTDDKKTESDTKVSSTTNENNSNDKVYEELAEFNKQFLIWLNTLVDKNAKRNLLSYLEQYEKSLKNVFAKEQIENLIEGEEKFEFDNKDKNVITTKDSESLKPKERVNVFANIKFPLFPFSNSDTAVTQGSSAPLFDFSNFKSSNFGKMDSNLQIEDNSEPPKTEFKAVVEEDSVYSKKCKVFVKVDNKYSDRGVGTLYLKPIKDSEKTQLIVRADTNLGNVLLNFILSEGLPTQRMGKNNVIIVCIPTPDDDQKPKSILIRVKTETDADELLENINKYKK